MRIHSIAITALCAAGLVLCVTSPAAARPGTGADGEVDRYVAWGPGPRASQALMLAVRAKALIDGRLAPSIDDVVALAEPILKHRMALKFAARADNQDLAGIIARLAAKAG